jgi:hypothetical protein
MFRAIERRIGICKQGSRVGPIARVDSDPDTEVEFKGVAVDLDVAIQRAPQPVRKQFGA